MILNKDERVVIAIDGPAGSGKSTVAREVASQLGIQYLDSGAFYRTLTLYLFQVYSTLMEEQSFPDWCATIENSINLEKVSIGLHFGSGGENTILLNGKNVSKDIRTPEITEKIKYVADKSAYREFVNRHIRTLAQDHSLVMDGRDIGTEVFPHTKYKFFLTASPEIRARRRLKELQEKGISVDYEAVLSDMIARDKSDENRKIAPLKRAKDAILVDTDGLSIKVVIETILSGLNDS